MHILKLGQNFLAFHRLLFGAPGRKGTRTLLWRCGPSGATFQSIRLAASKASDWLPASWQRSLKAKAVCQQAGKTAKLSASWQDSIKLQLHLNYVHSFPPRPQLHGFKQRLVRHQRGLEHVEGRLFARSVGVLAPCLRCNDELLLALTHCL